HHRLPRGPEVGRDRAALGGPPARRLREGRGGARDAPGGDDRAGRRGPRPLRGRAPRGAGRAGPRPRGHDGRHRRLARRGGAARRRRPRRRLGLRRRSPRPLPARPRGPALVPRPAAALEGADVLGEPRLPAPAHHRHRPPEAARRRRARALPEDQPGPRRAPPQGAGELSEPSAAAGSSTGRRLARNTVFAAVGEGSNLLLFLLGFLAARYLAPSAFGIYSVAFAFVGLFRILPDFGMAYASTLAISRDRSKASGL